LLTSADAAMYHAKKSGRNNFQFFAPAVNTFARARLDLEDGLRRALENGEFELHYEAKAEVTSGRTVSMEALPRHPKKGLVPPARFIPVAEEMGLIVPIGEWVLATAWRQNRSSQDAGLPAMRVAVNLSATQFRQKNLLDVPARVLRAVHLLERCHETG